ncbi:MAG: T9SS type A sorting domain-containing protein [Chitinophagales bacterium]
MRINLLVLLILIFAQRSIVCAQVFYEDAGWAEHGELTYTAFGWSMSNAGDINGDGFDDMVVTAIDYSNPPETNGEEGKVYIYYGGADGLADDPAWEFESDNDSSVLGFSSDGGDLNGDGYSDLVIGALQLTNGEYNEGAIFLWYGSEDGLSNAGPDWTIEYDQVYGLVGSGVAMSGDINSDGFNDLFVSAKMWDEGEPDEGKTWMFWGSAGGPVDAGWSWQANQEGAISGFPVNYAGDVNGDGFDDIIIGANQYDSIDIDDGLAVAFYGSVTGLSTTPDWRMSSGQKKCNFGHWVDGAGDVNGDGYDDVVISALLYESDSIEHNEGRIFVYEGSADGISHDLAWFGQLDQAEAQFGYSCAGAGDINNDGYDDVIGGSKYWDNGELDEGGAFVWFGSVEGLESNYCWQGDGDQDLGFYGRHVGGDGDFNNDGYSDFMVGAYRFSDSLEADGKGFVYYGAHRETDFHYLEDSFCLDSDDPMAIIDGLSGGSFFSDDAIVDPLTGEINIAASGGGTHYIYYESSGFCPIGKFKIYIQDTIGAENIFYYLADTFCISAENPLPVLLIPGTGAFYSDDAIVDAATGEINLSATGAGGYYTVYYSEITYQGCEVLASDSFYIEADPGFYYEQDTFCIYDANPFPIIDDVDPGTFYSDDLTVNSGSGKINLISSGAGGPFTVYYNSNSTCGIDSFIVWIMNEDTTIADFHYLIDSICVDYIDLVPIVDGMPGGYFYSDDAVVDSLTGEIDLLASGSGLFDIYYSVIDNSGCEIMHAEEINILPDADPFFLYNSSFYFQGEPDPSPEILGDTGIFSSSPPGLIFTDTLGTIELILSDTGTYFISQFSELGICSEEYGTEIIILPPCNSPDGITVSNIGSDSATISWLADDFYTGYYVYLISGTDTTTYYIENDTSFTFTGLDQETNYEVIIATDCMEALSDFSKVVDFTTAVGVNNLSNPITIKVYPNPATGGLLIESNINNSTFDLAMFNSDGKIVYEKRDAAVVEKISVEAFAKGIYLIRIVSGKYFYSEKVIIY